MHHQAGLTAESQKKISPTDPASYAMPEPYQLDADQSKGMLT